MALIRYLLYFLGVGVLTGTLAMLEIASPGWLQLQSFASPADTLGTSEYSPIEMLQPGILVVCGLLYAWVAQTCPSQRPIAVLFGGMALAFTIREFDYFLDLRVADNFWQVLLGLVVAPLITYTYRQRRRFRIAWLRLWPSPGITLLFAGAIIMFVFVQIVGHEPLWQAILGENYRRIVKLAVEEFIELSGYYFWMIGTIEYVFQARAIAMREPEPVVKRRRRSRRPLSEGRF